MRGSSLYFNQNLQPCMYSCGSQWSGLLYICHMNLQEMLMKTGLLLIPMKFSRRKEREYKAIKFLVHLTTAQLEFLFCSFIVTDVISNVGKDFEQTNTILVEHLTHPKKRQDISGNPTDAARYKIDTLSLLNTSGCSSGKAHESTKIWNVGILRDESWC